MKAVLISCLLGIPAFGQNILHYTETSGFDHGTRDVSLAMFQGIAGVHGFNIVNDNDGSTFNTLASLQQFGAIVFSNTSGAALLDAGQRANFEAYIAGGGSAMGIHAATDTYRHSTANGDNTGTWDFYAELIGASVQENPNHVDGTPLYDMSHIAAHASTSNLPDPWSKNEEYYYWEGGYYRDDNVPVLQVGETVGPNGEVNSYDAPRPMSWYRELSEGGRVFYTALGHAGSNYIDDGLFKQHITDALLWLLDPANMLPERPLHHPIMTVNDSGDICCPSCAPNEPIPLELITADGRSMRKLFFSQPCVTLTGTGLPAGIYILRNGSTAQRLMLVH